MAAPGAQTAPLLQLPPPPRPRSPWALFVPPPGRAPGPAAPGLSSDRPDTRPRAGSEAALPFPGSPRCRGAPGGPSLPGGLGRRAGSEPEHDGSTPRGGLRLGPAGRRQRPRRPEPLLTLLRARGPLAAPAEPGRAEPEPSRAAPNRTETKPKPSRAERNRRGAERSRAARSSKQDGGRGPSCARTRRSNRRMFTVKFPPSGPGPATARARGPGRRGRATGVTNSR